jgi:hypothetical protein
VHARDRFRPGRERPAGLARQPMSGRSRLVP